MHSLKTELSFASKWQKLLDLVSANYHLPAALIMKVDGDWIEVFMKCNSSKNPYIVGHKEKLDGLYCNEVICTNNKLLVPNALKDENWHNNPDIKLEMISYLGYPIHYPNGDIFGTICALDNKENKYSKKIENLLKDLRKLIELDLNAYFEYEYKRKRLEDSILNRENNNGKEIELSLSDIDKTLFKQLKKHHYRNLNSTLDINLLVNNIDSAIVILKPSLDKNGNLFDAEYIDMNEANEKIIGLKKVEVIGKTILDIFPETEEEWFKKFNPVVTKNQNVKFEMYYSSLKKYFNINAFSTGKEDLILICDDVTEHVNIKERIAISNFNYKQLFNKINTAIEVYTPIYDFKNHIIDLRYVDMNPLNEKIIKLPKTEVIGKTLLEVFPDTEPDFFSHFDKVRKINETYQFDTFYAPLNKHLACSIFKMSDNTFILTYNDITERVESYKRIENSERRHKAIFQNSGSVMMLINPLDGKIVDVNHAAINYTGYSRDVLLSMTIDQINTSNKKELTQDILKVENGEKNYFEFRHKIASGKIRDVEVYSSSFEEDGVKLLHSIIFDVTEKKKALSEVLKLSSIVEKAPVSVVITDRTGKIEYANKQNEFLTGYSLIELLGKNPRVLKSGKTNSSDYKNLWENILNGKTWEGEFYNKRKNRTYYWEQATIAPFYDNLNNSLSFIKIGKDITQKKEVENDLIQAKIKANESEHLKTSFLSNLSHEIRTPLNGILGFSEMLQNENLPHEKRKKYGDIVEASGQQLIMIIGDLVRTAELESGTLSIKNSMFQINVLLEEIRDFHFETCKAKGINLVIRNDSCNCSDFISDRKRIRQTLDNIINNAIKFTQAGEIELATKCANGSILFSIKDTGKGISKEDKEMIFERFKQIEADKSYVNDGNGLGLHICKEIVELLGGEIWVESEVGVGSTFKFTVKKREKVDF